MKQSILLVEDDQSISEMVEAYLTVEGIHVVHAVECEEALRICGLDTYDLIVLDVMLPKLNGIDLLKKIRESSLSPVIILSAKDGDVDKALGLGFGADDYL